MNKDIINDCINIAIEKKPCKIINEYVEYWTNSANYSVEQLDSKYYYLIYAHNSKLIDIFNLNNSIFLTLFLIL